MSGLNEAVGHSKYFFTDEVGAVPFVAMTYSRTTVVGLCRKF